MAIQNRYEFMYYVACTNSNPNGDPDMGNMPRIDPQTMQGFITDGAIDKGGELSSSSREAVMSEVRAHFKPEFLNRIDDIIIFTGFVDVFFNCMLPRIIPTNDETNGNKIIIAATQINFQPFSTIPNKPLCARIGITGNITLIMPKTNTN